MSTQETSKRMAEQVNSASDFKGKRKFGICWYTKLTYKKCLAIYDDPGYLPLEYEEWLESAEKLSTCMEHENLQVIQIYMDPVSFPQFCHSQGFSRIDESARAAYRKSFLKKTTEGI